MQIHWPVAPVAILAALVLSANPAAAAVDCGCGLTGAYVSPIEPVPLSDSTSGASPHGKYLLTATPNPGSIQVTIDRVSPAGQILSMAIPEGSNWGFSPDDDRFTYHFLTGSMETVRLFDLTSLTPSTRIWEGPPMSPVSSETVFSPNGKYLLYVVIDATPQTFLKLVDAQTGALRYQASPLPYMATADSADSYGIHGWGFSPDPEDRTFLYATDLGQQWHDLNLVNLPAQARVHNENILAIAAFWQFSPCGDAVAIVTQDNTTQATTQLRRTFDGVRIGSRVDPFLAVTDTNSDISFSSTASQHVATVGVTPYDLAPNLAGVACPPSPPLQSVSLAPDTVTGGSATVCTVTLSGPAEAGGGVVAMTYTPGGNVSGVASVTVPAGHASASFGITTGAVTSPTPVTVSGTMNLISKQATLTLLPMPAELNTFLVSPGEVLAGTSPSASVSLTAGAPAGGARVTFTSSNPAAATIDSSVVFVEGQDAAVVTVTTLPVEVRDSTVFTASYRGRNRTQTLVVRPVALERMRLTEHCVLGGDSLYAEVGLDGPAGPAGAHVALSSDQAAVTPPDSVVVPPGERFALFGIGTSPVVARVVAHLSASFRGSAVGESLAVFDKLDVVIRDLGTLRGFFDHYPYNPGYYGYYSDGNRLNNLGEVIGASDSPAKYNGAFRWKAGVMSDLGQLGPYDFIPRANAINDSGVVVGEVDGVGCTFVSGIVTDIPLVDGPAYGINRAGHIVGGAGLDHDAWFYDGTATSLGLPAGARYSVASANNDSDVVVGTNQDSLYFDHPFRWTAAGGMVALPVPPGTTYCYPLDINNAGAIVGYCQIGFYEHAIAWKDTSITRLEGQGTRFLAVNNTGLTVGISAGLATVWNGSTPYLIRDAIQNNCSVRVSRVFDVNDAGQMAGTALVGVSTDDISHAVLLTSKSTAPWMQGSSAAEASGHVVAAEPTRVTLLWATREIVLGQAQVERQDADGSWAVAGTPQVSGSSQLTFTDAGLTPGREYAYRLAVLEGGVTRYVGTISVRTPRQLALAINGFLPNPARAGDVSMSVSLPVAGDARVELFDVRGRRSASHDARGLAAGMQEIRLTEARSLAPGLYFVRLSQSGHSRISKLAIAR
jgi:probable HAF family extracellular repeat protein